MERCHAISQLIPTIDEVTASRHSQMYQGTRTCDGNGATMKTYYPMFISMATTFFQSWEEIVRLVSEFEAGTLPHARWKHREHLTVAFWYVSRFDEAEATDRIRSGILFLNNCHGTPNTDTRGYHETLTRFWIGVVVKFLRKSHSEGSELELANQLIEQ